MTEFGRLDILVNNAAHQATIDSIEEISSEEWDRTMRTNLYGMFYLCKAAAPVMRPGSAIINTSSIQSKSPTPELLAYATTKGAIANFTAGLAGMLAEKGIRVNAVDDVAGEVEHLLVELQFRDVVENLGRVADLVVELQGVGDEAGALRADEHRAETAEEHGARDRRSLALGEPGSDHGEGGLGRLAVRGQVVGAIKVERVDLGAGDERLDVERRRSRAPPRLTPLPRPQSSCRGRSRSPWPVRRAQPPCRCRHRRTRDGLGGRSCD